MHSSARATTGTLAAACAPAHSRHERRPAHRLIQRFMWVAVLLSAAAGPTAAHNGRLAVAAGIDAIVVDGDLADWPEHLPRYPITRAASGQPPVDSADLTADFRIAYSTATGRLLVAVTAIDESIVVPDRGSGWGHADGCELYIDVTHGRNPAFQLARWGRETVVLGGSGFLGLTKPARDVAYEVAVGRSASGHVYEWAIDLTSTEGGFRLEPGIDLAFDAAVIDRDEDGSFSWISWGPHTAKLAHRDRLGDVITAGTGGSLEEALAASGDLLGRTRQRAEATARRTAAVLAFFAGALLAIAVVHLLLFLFQRETRVNLYYAVFAGATVAAITLTYLLPASVITSLLSQRVVSLWLVTVYAASLLLLYAQFHGEPTRWGRFLVAGLGAVAVLRLMELAAPLAGRLAAPPVGLWRLLFSWPLTAVANVLLAATFVTIASLVVGAVVRRRSGAWSIGVSFLLFALGAGTVVSGLAEGDTPHPALLAAILLPMVAMSYRLARSVGDVHRDLARRYQEVQRLSTQLRARNTELELAHIKISEQSRQVEEASRLKSDLLARVSHDLRTPMNAIIGYTRILLRRLQGQIDDRQYRNLENIRISADMLLALINDVLDLSRLETGRTEVHPTGVDVASLAAECAAAVEPLLAPGVQLVTDVPDSLELHTDPDRLRQIVMNLLGNAVKYTESGSITLRVRRTDGGGADISVADTGVGIPAEDLPRIFDQFHQVSRKDKKREGSGLGLAIAQRSAALLGGTIQVQSTPGEGSTFTVHLPLQLRVNEHTMAPA